ncbi:hypothetical protein, partial [Parvibaculum sp.]|uniref:hypothetical protein n=1 Tax=Parvibaculum sp. TaxID=2024848 RepID=UPI002BB577F2
VLEVDVQRKRIGLTMRLGDEAAPAKDRGQQARTPSRPQVKQQRAPEPSGGGALADALRKAGFDGRK